MRAIRRQLDEIYPNIQRQPDMAFPEFDLEECEATEEAIRGEEMLVRAFYGPLWPSLGLTEGLFMGRMDKNHYKRE